MKKHSTFLKNKFVFLFILLCFTYIGHGQTISKCFNLEKIKKIYAATYIEINSMLFQESWEIVANANQMPFVLGNDTVMYDNFSQWKFELSVDKWTLSQYRTKGIDPVLVLQTSKSCYETIESDLQNKNSIPQKIIKDSVRYLHIFQIIEGMDIIFVLNNNTQPYQIIIGNYTQLDSLISSRIIEKEKYVEILQAQQQLIQTTMEQADSLKNTDDYLTAIQVLEQLMNQHFITREELIGEVRDVKNKIHAIQKEFDIKRFNSFVELAENAFAEEKYAVAKENLLKAQQIDFTSEIVLQKLKEIEKIESMYVIRKDSIFNYFHYQKPVCDTIQNIVFGRVRDLFLGTDAGDIKFSFTLFTDTLGKNLSFYQIDTFSLRSASKSFIFKDTKETWALFLDTLTKIRSIPAVKIDYLFVNAATAFQHHSSWQSSFDKVIYGGKKIKFSPSNLPVSEKNRLENYFKTYTIQDDKSLPNGRYTIKKREILYQDSLFTDLVLEKFYTVGAEAMFYSALFPGAGSLAATQGKKGWAALSTFIVFSGIGVTGILVSNSLQKNNSASPTVTNVVKFASYGALGISGVIYISDIFLALKRGLNNFEKSRALKAKLKKETIHIQEFPQQIEP